ncbi:hypothetical protein SAMN05421858_4483 [Haladaptatus litoreus]|uniref:Uncharacterized protein n=2 Tax=Haladaptatus litoreus TaxID=553468 RepID=A0A1N7ETK2_9EURY|nr:hypothetical protein SAMN05421858_4483 [Haladaptatus litoreus]
MQRLNALFRPVERYADAVSPKTHGIVAVVSLCSFIGVIVLGFVPVTRQIEMSGYSTSDLQDATSRAEVDTILQALEPVMDHVMLLSVLDYIFILAGFFLFFSLHSIILNTLDSHDRLVLIPKIGMILTISSRLFDSLENLWVILIYTNPEDYATVLISLMNASETVKWTLVRVEYPMLGLAIVLVLLIRFTSLFDGHSEHLR